MEKITRSSRPKSSAMTDDWYAKMTTSSIGDRQKKKLLTSRELTQKNISIIISCYQLKVTAERSSLWKMLESDMRSVSNRFIVRCVDWWSARDETITPRRKKRGPRSWIDVFSTYFYFSDDLIMVICFISEWNWVKKLSEIFVFLFSLSREYLE